MKQRGTIELNKSANKNQPPSVTLLMPVLNEINGLKLSLPFIRRDLFDDILVVDGGSKDGSVEYVEEMKIRHIRQRRPGLAFAVFDAVVELKTDYVIEFSPDGNCLVEDLPKIVERISAGYDLVVVSRYLPPAKSEDDNVVTAFGNWMFTRLISVLGRFPITDALTIYRGFRRDIATDPDFIHYLKGPVFEPLISAMASMKNLKICEIPGNEPKRIGGESKMRIFYNGYCISIMILRCYLNKFIRNIIFTKRTK
jgi:Glycosyltransferases involved in cell wall biogenesis